jgi:hypothetical protein
VDRWEELQSYERFKASFREAYQEIDDAMEELTASEVKIGVFESGFR